MSLINDHITVRNGQACIRGTEVAVVTIWDSLVLGKTPVEIIQTYPGLTEADIQAVKNLLEDYLTE